MRVRSIGAVLGCCGLLFACAGAPPPRAATARTEIIIDEPEIVRAHATGAPAQGLPALPVELERTSSAFQRAFEEAQPLIAAPPPAAPPEDAAAYRAWLDTDFRPWLSARGAAVAHANAALGEVANGPAVDERVVGGALVGLMDAHVHDQLLAVPAPPELRADEKLLRIYQNEIHTAAAGWLEQALISLRDCAAHSARQVDPAFGPWLALCQDHMARLQQAQAAAGALAESVARDREADRIAAEGPRPAGPDACWSPSQAAAQESVSPTPSAAAGAGQEPGTRPLLSPRDLRYGARDATTGVRVSVALADSAPDASNATLAALASGGGPLIAVELEQRLALCFAQHVRQDAAITVAVDAAVAVQASGRVASVTLTPERGADVPSKPLLRCLQQALTRSAFGENPAGGVTQWHATYCLRRD